MAGEGKRPDSGGNHTGTLYRVHSRRHGEQTLLVGGTAAEAARMGAVLVDRTSWTATKLRMKGAGDVVHVNTPLTGSVVYKILEARGPDAGRVRTRRGRRSQAGPSPTANSWGSAMTLLRPLLRKTPSALGNDEIWQRLRTDEAKIAALVIAAEEPRSAHLPASEPQATWIREWAIERSHVPDLISDTWSTLPRDAKLRVCALVARHDIPWSRLEVLVGLEGDLGMTCLLNLVLQPRLHGEDKLGGFWAFHDDLLARVIGEAWGSQMALDLKSLLPKCREDKYLHCEARVWRRADGSTALWCRDGVCTAGRAYADFDLPGSEWRLQEYLQQLAIEPSTAVAPDPVQYVTRLAGWLNRLNEIRARMRCRVCGKVMAANTNYAKHLARYNATVFRCVTPGCSRNGESDASNQVYLSHCWACEAMIDSRDCTQRVAAYYLCLQCGSGPMYSRTYRQGDVCPSCGRRNMQPISDKHYRCADPACGHQIKRPPAHEQTGPGSTRMYRQNDAPWWPDEMPYPEE